MGMMEIYLDNAATTRPSASVLKAMQEVLTEDYGNPSSLHRKGFEAEKKTREAARILAELLHVKEKEIYFTSGGTESNNWAILGGARAKIRQGRHLITTQIEHPSVKGPMQQLKADGWSLTELPVDEYGILNPSALKEAMGKDTVLVSIMAVNNEIGSLQKIKECGAVIKEFNPQILFHVDGVQAFGKLALYPEECQADLLSGSAHKIHGPKGSGFLYIKEGVRIQPILFGGGQQKDLRSGTENVPGIVGLGEAAREAGEHMGSNRAHLYRLRHQLTDGLKNLEGVIVNGPREDKEAAPHIISATFRGVRSEVLLHALEEKGIYASAGSACSSHKREISPVLKAIGMDREEAESTLRISLSRYNTSEEIEYLLVSLGELLPLLRRFSRK